MPDLKGKKLSETGKPVTKKCKRCGKPYFGEDKFCDNCMGDLSEHDPQEYYARWKES